MGQGVTKSGSPTPSEIAPSMDESRSKYFRMPDGEISLDFFDM